jgi:hypothetical protein
MTILASTIIDRLSKQLVDVANVRWSRAQLLDWLSVGQRFIVALQPQAGSATTTVKLTAGTRQTIPADSVVVIYDVIRNMGADGLTPGRAVGSMDRTLMDRCRPMWHSEGQSAVSQSAALDTSDPNVFWVYPPSNGTNYVQVRCALLPAPIASESAQLTIPDRYEDALTHYAMFRALSKNADFASSAEADKYLTLFNAAIGATATAQQAGAQA